MDSTANFSDFWIWRRTYSSTTRSGPEHRRYRGPIFISDAVVPWGRETILLDRLRKDALAMRDDDSATGD